MNRFPRIAFAAIAFFTSCKKEEKADPPTSSFSYSGVNLVAPAKISFTNNSSNAVSYSWDFGDGGTSYESSPIHVYNSPGNFTITLKAIGGAGAGTATSTKTITIGQRYTMAKVTYLKINSIPALNASGGAWDSDGTIPDLFFKITDGTTILQDASSVRFTNQLTPVQWNFTSTYNISPLATERRFEIWDYDSGPTNDFIGLLSFIPSLLQDNSDDPYPTKKVLTSGLLSVELGLQWQ